MNLSMSSSSRSSLTAATQVGLLAGPFLSMLDSNIVNVALPDIALQLHSSLETAQWIVSGYLLALAAVLAASAYLAKRFGTSRVYLASLLGFTLASALCALAPTMGVLIAARALQGALGAPLVPLAMGMLLGQGAARLWYILFICYQRYDLTGEANASLWSRKGVNSNGYPVT